VTLAPSQASPKYDDMDTWNCEWAYNVTIFKMSEITLHQDGDFFEKHYYELFIQKDFPSYERFWIKFVIPLTDRPKDIHFKSNDVLTKLGLGDQEICISQLHYSVVRHLARVYDIRAIHPLNISGLTEGMVRLVGAQDMCLNYLSVFLT
jgi:hypothetical protein